jgi:hypothetical protein
MLIRLADDADNFDHRTAIAGIDLLFLAVLLRMAEFFSIVRMSRKAAPEFKSRSGEAAVQMDLPPQFSHMTTPRSTTFPQEAKRSKFSSGD